MYVNTDNGKIRRITKDILNKRDKIQAIPFIAQSRCQVK